MKVSVGCQGRVVNPFLQAGAMDHTCSRAAFYEPHSMQMQFWKPGESLETPNQHSAYHESDQRLTPNRQLDCYDNISFRGHDRVEESSVGGVSSGTNLSQDELRIAEVNPVTFEVMPSNLRHHREKIVTEHDNNSSPIASSAHSPSKPCHKVDVVFDGESGYPTVCLSECHCALPMSPRKSSPALQHLNHVLEGDNCSRIKLMCSFGGRIQSRPVDGQLRYTGGETRIVAVNRGIVFAKFMYKMTQIYGLPVVLKYQLPGEDLDALISVSSDDDFQNMIEEYDKLELNGGVSRLRLFFFTCPCEHETQPAGLESDMKDCHIDLDQQHYIGVRNGITDKLSGLHLKDVPDSLPAKIIHEVPSTMIGLSSSRHLSRVPSAPSSSPSSPSVGSRLRGLCMGEVLNDNTGLAVHTHGGDVKSHQDGYAELVCPFHCDHPPHFPGESPKTLYDNPFSKVDSRWGPKTGVHGLDSQVNFVNQSEHHIDQMSGVGAANKWHDAQHPPDMLVPAGGFICHHHQPQLVSQQTPLTTGQPHVEDMVGKGEGFQHCPLDMCKPSQAFYHPYQATPHLPQAGYCCVSQPLHGQYAIPHVSDHSPFMQGPLQSHVQVPYGVAGTTAYKLGSAPSSPRMRIQDIRGNCNCIQHTQVHRGINVSLGDGNRTPSSFDQCRKPGLPICSRFCDNLANSNEPSGWQKQPGHFIGFEGDQQEHIDNSWQHIHDMSSVLYHMPDSQEDTNALQYHHTPLYNEIALQQPHDLQAANKKRYPGFNRDESGRQPIEKARAYSAYMEPGGQIGDPLTEERIAILERTLEHLPFHKNEDYDCEIHSVGSFSSTDAIAGSLSRAPSDKGWFDVPPHLQTEDLHALDELPMADSAAEFTIVVDEKNLPSVGLIEMKEESHGYSVPVVADTAVGEPVLDLHHLSPSVNEPLEAGYENHIATFPHALSSNTTSSKFGPRAAGGWEALPSNSLSITTLEKSPTNTVLPIYDQSPLSSSNMANFSFEQRQDNALAGAEQINNAGSEFTDDRSFFTEDLISKGGGFDDIHKVMGNAQPCSESTPEAALKSRTMEDVSSPHSMAGQIKSGVLFETGLHDVKVPEEWPAGVSAVIQERISNPVTHEDELTEVGSVCAKEFEDVPVTKAEKEAIARGLQIIKNDDLEDLKELGTGTYGTVFHGKWRGSDVAIKRIKASCFTGRPSVQERLVSDFWREAGMLSQLHHPNIVAFYGVVPDGPGGTLATVTEYMVNGSLKQVLQKKDRTIDRKKRLLIAMDAAFGMEYLHSKNVVHFDLKSENLLVNMRDAHRPICKVGDFGLSKVKHQTLVSGGVRGTLPWMAPELLSGKNGRVTEKVDVFSFGIVMWELLTGDEPYANMHCGAIIGGIVNNTLRPLVPNWCDPCWRSLMERCWSGDPADRPTFTEVARELRAIAASMNVK